MGHTFSAPLKEGDVWVNINKILNDMRESSAIQDYESKGALGEEAVFAILAERPDKCLLYNSLRYPYQTNRQGIVYLGNIKYENNVFVDYSSDTTEDEIDCVYITKYRIFPIEVKSYHVKRIDVYDHWINRVDEPMDKSPVAQAEKHARHMYHAIYDVLPKGDPSYIKPVVCFVDQCVIRDARDKYFQNYIPVCTLNALNKVINKYNKPLKYALSLKDIEHKIKNVSISIKKQL